MATLVFAKDFLEDYADLEPPVRAKVRELPGKFSSADPHTRARLEKIVGSADPRVRTVRVDKYWRGIVFYPGSDDTYVLTRVLGEEKANTYAEKVKFGVNPLSGAIEVTDLSGIEAAAPTATADQTTAGLLDKVSDDDLLTIGIVHDAIPVIRRITTTKELDALTSMLPRGQADALQLLHGGFPIAEIVTAISGTDPDDDTTDEGHAGPVDTDDVDTAIRRPASTAEFVLLDEDSDDLAEWLNEDFELWRLFLHPTQHRFAFHPGFNGPAKLTGTAGTGKTVTALHRAQHLAAKAEQSGDRNDRILFTTFTRALATDLQRQITTLCTPAEARRIDVINIDAYASKVLTDSPGPRPRPIVDRQDLRSRWEAAIAHVEADLTPEFIAAEWDQVVLGAPRQITSMREYLAVPRKGRGVRLSRAQRAEAWRVIEEFTTRLADDNLRTLTQIADDAARVLDSRTVRPYRHAIIDEAQDLHPAQWRLVRAAVRPAEEALTDDLFIVGDAHQRIYGNTVVLSRLGIETRGRSRRLRLNYRTTQQIHRWSLGVRQDRPVDDLDGATDGSQGSHASAFGGTDPTVTGHTTAAEEARAVADRVTDLIDSGVPAHQIAVIARTNASLDRIADKLTATPTQRLTDDTKAEVDRVVLATMHKVKGGEYRAVVLTDISKGQVPLDSIDGVITPERVDKRRHDEDLDRERNLLYVAASRARDTLDVHYHGAPSPFLAVVDR